MLARPEILSEPAVVAALHDLAFMSGGPGCVVPLGLLVAGIALPARNTAPLPRWFTVAGLALAAVAALATVVLLADGAVYLLPVARFGGLSWLIAAAALLPRSQAVAR